MGETTPANCQKSINFMFFEAGVDTFFLLGSLQTNTHFQTLVVTPKSICLSLCSRKPSQNAQSIELFTAEAESVHVSTYLEQKKEVRLCNGVHFYLKQKGEKTNTGIHLIGYHTNIYSYILVCICFHLQYSSNFHIQAQPGWQTRKKIRSFIVFYE